MIHIYHPNKAVKGFACSFWFSDRDNCIFATILKQSGWDDKTQNGTFKASMTDPTKKVNIKLSFIEIGGILDCIERNRPFSQYHDSDASPKQISFSPWMAKAWTDASDVVHPATQSGFSFSVSVIDKQDTTQKNAFYIGLSFAEARYIREFLIYSMHRYFSGFKSTTARVISEPEQIAPEPEEPRSEPIIPKPVNNPAPIVVEDPLTGF
jgi:hypothetical protein